METSSFPINCVTPGSVFISRLQASISSLFKTRFSKKSCVFAGVHHIGGIFEDEIPVQRETLFSPVATFSRMGGNPDAFPSGSSVWFSSCSFLEMWTQAADRWGNHFSNTRYEAQTKVHLFYFSWRFPKEHPFSVLQMETFLSQISMSAKLWLEEGEAFQRFGSSAQEETFTKLLFRLLLLPNKLPQNLVS